MITTLTIAARSAAETAAAAPSRVAGAAPALLLGRAGDAIDSAGAHASIGSITNSGKIVGNVEIDNQASVTIKGGTGKTFGSWTGGTITIGTGNLTFASGDTALGDDISVDGGAGTVTNMRRLRIAARGNPEAFAADPACLIAIIAIDVEDNVFEGPKAPRNDGGFPIKPDPGTPTSPSPLPFAQPIGT